VQNAVLAELRAHFRPEFLNRIDEIVLFKPLTHRQIEQIVDLLVADLGRRLADRHLNLKISDEARTLIAKEGYDPVYGARPLKRYLQREVETRIAKMLIADEVPDHGVIAVGLNNGELSVSTLPHSEPSLEAA